MSNKTGSVRISCYEQQGSKADMETAAHLAKALDVPLAYQFAASDEMAELILGFHQLDSETKAKVIAQVQKLVGKAE